MTLQTDIQALLKARGYDLGSGGPNRDGIDGDLGNRSLTAILTELQLAGGKVNLPVTPRALTESDYVAAAAALSPRANAKLIKAVKTVESGGAWFTDMRADILDLDGPGGFIDGDMPKILFEAHHFSRLTNHVFDADYPNISSPHWNRALYVGGAAEYRRLDAAMKLNRTAALKSASWGLFQIMGFNHVAAGYANVEDFVAAMKESEGKQLLAFVSFVKSNGMTDKLLKIMDGDGAPFAAAYNGSGYAVNHYDTKLVSAYRAA